MRVTKLRELASAVCANADHYSVLAMDLAFEALEVANRIEFSRLSDDWSKDEIADAEKIASDIGSGKAETFSLQEVAKRMGVRIKSQEILGPEEIIIRAFARRPNPRRPNGSGSIRKKNGGFYAKSPDEVPIGKFATREAAESALIGSAADAWAGLCRRKRRVGTIRLKANRYEVKLRGKYVGRYETKEEAESALCRIISVLEKIGAAKP